MKEGAINVWGGSVQLRMAAAALFPFAAVRAIISPLLASCDPTGKTLLRIRSGSVVPLSIVVILAIFLALAASGGGALARSTFQSSPLVPEDTPEVPTPEGILAETPSPAAPEPTVEVPAPIATEPPTEPTTLPPGFLPAPTLTSPDAVVPLPPAAGQPPLVGPAVPVVEPSPVPTSATSAVPGAAQLIDNAIVALSYVWLCCGVALLALGAAVLVWLARRSARR